MRKTSQLAALIALTSALFATAAQAQPRATNAVFITGMAQTACQRSFADPKCASYQNRLISSIAIEARNATRPVSRREVTSRQLDALLATID